MKTQTGEVVLNLGIEEIGPNEYSIHMPNTFGEIKEFPFKNGWSVSWPVNPHFTGFSGIVAILQGTDKFKSASFRVAR
jgi:hypothetical protein